MPQDVSQIRNAAREYSNAFNRWMKAPKDSERETKLHEQMVTKIENLAVIIVKHDGKTRERETALMQGLNNNRAAADFLTEVLRGMNDET